MAMAHKMNRAMEPLPESKLQTQKDKLSKALKKHHSGVEISRTGQNISYLRDPAVRKKAGMSIRKKSLEKMAMRGIHRCPECLDETPSRKTDFLTSQQLATHRRAAHGVAGVQHEKTQRSLELKALRDQRVAAGKAPQGRPSTKYIPQLPFKCDVEGCVRTFKNQHGLNIHVAQAHKVSTLTALTPSTSKELNHGNSSTQGITQPETSEARNGHGHRDNASAAQALAIAHVTGVIENVLLTAAAKYDLPPRQFAERSLVTLIQRYQAER
jgi:hypothetical protein